MKAKKVIYQGFSGYEYTYKGEKFTIFKGVDRDWYSTNIDNVEYKTKASALLSSKYIIDNN